MKHWIFYVVLVLALCVCAFLLYMQTAIQQENDASAGRAIHQLAEWVGAGKTNLVCHAITNSHAIMSESGFSGMSFEKILIMSESDHNKSERASH